MSGTHFTAAELGEILSLVEQEAARLGNKLQKELDRDVWQYRSSPEHITDQWSARIARLATVATKLRGVRAEALAWERQQAERLAARVAQEED